MPGSEGDGGSPSGRLPCTVICGHEGSGKTELLKHILNNAQELRCSVLQSGTSKGGERCEEGSSSCMCCTRRDELPAEAWRLAATGAYDCLLLECCGCAEPGEVIGAINERREGLRLGTVPCVDTAITVVDAAALLPNLTSAERMCDRGRQGDERGLAELLLGQIEFADVIVLNKVDLVSAREQKQLLALLSALNPGADVVPATHGHAALDRVVCTGRFSTEGTARGAGWLKALQGASTPKPAGRCSIDASTWVYSARRPFHPGRLHAFITQHFVLQQPHWEHDCAGEGSSHSHNHGHGDREIHSHNQAHLLQQAVLQASAAAAQAAAAMQQATAGSSHANSADQALLAAAAAATSAAAAASAAAALIVSQLNMSGGSIMEATHQPASGEGRCCAHQALVCVSPAEAAHRSSRLAAAFGQLLRSRGLIWLATRPSLYGEWSQAGGILQLGVGGPWYASLPPEEWPQGGDQREALLRDFQGPDGDRRQEVAVVGLGVDHEALFAALDACLCTEEEVAAAAAGLLHDPFVPWPSLEHMLEGAEEEEGEDEVEEEGEDEVEEEGEEGQARQRHEREATPSSSAPPQGGVRGVQLGGAELQQCFDAMAQRAAEAGSSAPTLGVVSWHAPWSEGCNEAAAALSAAASAHPGVAFFSLDVEASPANTALALEKVMRKPESRRVGARPALRSGERFPCITLHYLPSLQPWATLAGPAAVEQLHQALAEHAEPKQATSASAPAAQASGGSSDRSSSKERSRLTVLKKGAVQAKEILAEGREAGAPVIVVWTHSGGEDAVSETAALRGAAVRAADDFAGLLLVDADAAACKANELLASALKVAGYPEVHVYRDMKLASKLSGPSATPSDLLRLAEQLAHRGPPASPAAAAAQAAPPGPPTTSASQSTPVQHETAAGPPHVFDPPDGKFARPGAAKRFPDGRFAYFFANMPCLRCGCPWWSSEEWDARCMRCGWDCERGGYDDDSQPLPQHRQKWERLTAAIRQGRTPPWSGRSKA